MTKISKVSLKDVFYSLISFNNHERTDREVGIYFYSREHWKKNTSYSSPVFIPTPNHEEVQSSDNIKETNENVEKKLELQLMKT